MIEEGLKALNFVLWDWQQECYSKLKKSKWWC